MTDFLEPHRCPECNALVIDRRSPTCTTCHAALPAEWIMTPQQNAKMQEIDAESRAAHLEEMRTLDPASDPNVPAFVKFLDQPVKGNRY